MWKLAGSPALRNTPWRIRYFPRFVTRLAIAKIPPFALEAFPSVWLFLLHRRTLKHIRVQCLVRCRVRKVGIGVGSPLHEPGRIVHRALPIVVTGIWTSAVQAPLTVKRHARSLKRDHFAPVLA